MQIHSLNLDFSTSLTSLQGGCFTCMPNLMSLSMCETRITNLWTTTASLSKLPSLVELRFQNNFCCNGTAPFASFSGAKTDGTAHLALSTDGTEITKFNSVTEEIRTHRFSLDNAILNQEIQCTSEGSSDDSETEFSSRRGEYGLLKKPFPDTFMGWNEQIDSQNEVDFGASLVPNEVESLSGAFSLRHISDFKDTDLRRHFSHFPPPICFEKHYREFMIASLPRLKVLDNLLIKETDREMADFIFTQYFESLPYRRKHKESVLSILQQRVINDINTHGQILKRKQSFPSGRSQCFYSRSLCAAKMGSSAWPLLQPLSISGVSSDGETRTFRPRQFEYHPSDSSLMAFGTLDGEVVAVNHENGKIVSCIPSLGEMNSVLGLCWLKKHPYKLIAGSDNGSLKLHNIPQRGISNMSGCPTFDEFDQLTSVHVNSTDELFLASGYSKHVALYDIDSGRRLQVFTDMHRKHINVVKFSNHSPSIFATSSFDHDVKLWDLRQKPINPCYTASSSRGNVMVCFSPDDHYLLVSAMDNEVKQLLAVDGRLHLNFEIAPTRSSQNYTRSYYMNGRDYIISGSCDEHVVHICCAQSGRRLRDISLEGKGPKSSMFLQSLRGDPFRDFNMSILVAYTRPSSESEIVKVNLLASSNHQTKGSSLKEASCPISSFGG